MTVNSPRGNNLLTSLFVCVRFPLHPLPLKILLKLQIIREAFTLRGACWQVISYIFTKQNKKWNSQFFPVFCEVVAAFLNLCISHMDTRAPTCVLIRSSYCLQRKATPWGRALNYPLVSVQLSAKNTREFTVG